ncbi:phosphoribosyl-AMP cyclohydrolase [Arthrospiribacter ruber]|uniref:Histidine biosynthesis bifunctional protein HisIE n=1 Tax=Arthrospiribacter ruber TaxID=2487934 RepID=A0A951MIC2_9BACT|nr:phosphoribosyl-AMP cyclohydrolase [Arthrospiribacter ruber]MBW3470275.1 phosphoribosyl-AMP cyclohydrolase [Arthrospiribacter ruber]
MKSLLEESCVLKLQFPKRGGLLPVAVQELITGQILMLASVNHEAFEYTLRHKIAVFYSTSRDKLWVKGQTSGNQLKVDKILIDCDQDALVYQVTLVKGGVCHTFNKQGENRKACFHRTVNMENKALEFLPP